MMPVGGYFELELKNGERSYHDTPYNFKSGRSSLKNLFNYIEPSLVYVPYYTCNALLEPFEERGIKYQFYEIDKNLEPKELFELGDKEYFLYINYFDLKRAFVD